MVSSACSLPVAGRAQARGLCAAAGVPDRACLVSAYPMSHGVTMHLRMSGQFAGLVCKLAAHSVTQTMGSGKLCSHSRHKSRHAA